MGSGAAAHERQQQPLFAAVRPHRRVWRRSDLSLIIPGHSFSLASPGFDIEDDTRDRVVVGGLRKELYLGERCETQDDYHERCRRCDAVDVFHGYLFLMV
jgi:hypothetical protein